MFYMQSYFSLKDGVTLDAFKASLDLFARHMKDQSLLVSIESLKTRSSDTPMDTDEDRFHQYFFTSVFTDIDQCDRSYEYIEKATGDARRIHNGVMEKIAAGAVFVCWDDVE